MKNAPIVRMSDAMTQDQKLRKLVGNIPLTSFVDILFVADLEANARQASVSRVTDAIEDSLEHQPELFHYKTKGILAAGSQVDVLERDRYRLHFNNPKLEGIIDGGHNTLAIGRFVLKTILTELYGEDDADKTLKKVKRWADLKEVMEQYEADIRDNKDCLPEAFVPIEMIYPANDDPDAQSYFEDQILVINAARNNNAQLKEEAKANWRGLYDELKANIDTDIEPDVEWRTGEGGRIKARELVALSLIPLSKLDIKGTKSIQDNPTVIFSAKAQCIEIYNTIMGNEEDGIVEKVEGDIVKIVDPGVRSALKLMRDIPELYDFIYELFPKAYSHGFGKITGVKTLGSPDQLKSQRGSKDKAYLSKAPRSHFYRTEVSHSFGDGFIYPIVVALRELMAVNEDGEVHWTTDPKTFIRDSLKKVMETYKDMISGQNYDPAKVGKTKGAYNLVAQAFKHELDAKELERLRAQAKAQLGSVG